MPGLRFRVSHGVRVDIHEVRAAEVLVGRAPESDLVVDHPSVADRHAQVLLRRGKLILVDRSGKRTAARDGEQRVTAPIVVEPGATFSVGEVSLAAWPVEHPRPVGPRDTLAGYVLGEGLESGHPDVLRFRARTPSGVPSEVVLARAPGGEPLASGWSFRACPVPEGVRLAQLEAAFQDGVVGIAVDAAVVILARVAEALGELHAAGKAHGAVGPSLIQLGFGGEVALLDAWPGLEGADASFRAPERRTGRPASIAGDAWSFAALGNGLLQAADRRSAAKLSPHLAALFVKDAKKRSSDVAAAAAALLAEAHGMGLDPTAVHVARVARLLAAPTPKPLSWTGA